MLCVVIYNIHCFQNSQSFLVVFPGLPLVGINIKEGIGKIHNFEKVNTQDLWWSIKVSSTELYPGSIVVYRLELY